MPSNVSDQDSGRCVGFLKKSVEDGKPATGDEARPMWLVWILYFFRQSRGLIIRIWIYAWYHLITFQKRGQAAKPVLVIDYVLLRPAQFVFRVFRNFRGDFGGAV